MSQVIDGLSGVRVNVDDVLVWDPNDTQRKERFQRALYSDNRNEIALNLVKYEIDI